MYYLTELVYSTQIGDNTLNSIFKQLVYAENEDEAREAVLKEAKENESVLFVYQVIVYKTLIAKEILNK